MDKLSSLIGGALAKRGLAGHALASLALHRVNGWLIERFPSGGAPARAERIADGVLHIACSHSIILQELQSRLPELRAFLTLECPFLPVSEIRLARGNPPA